MDKTRSFSSILIPSATVFISSACIMIIELVAGRLTARHLGSSLYTWTSIIGVVLAGITIGNWLGGRIADKYPARKALASLFGLASVACVVIVALNNVVGEWIWLWKFNWPARVFSHVSIVFLVPSVLLGTISPVVAKMALDRGLSTGRTIGDIYAWGAAGSIAGTFLAGFYLIASMGTIAIIWTVGASLLLLASLYWARLWALYLWASIFLVLVFMGMAPVKWAKDTGPSLGLRVKPDPDILYEDETQYCYVAVKRVPEKHNKRIFMQDKLMHSKIAMDNLLDLQYTYGQIYSAVTHQLSRSWGRDKLSILVIGGGGYVFPRYVQAVWPGSRVDVAEIDPGVTEAAMQALELPYRVVNVCTGDLGQGQVQKFDIETWMPSRNHYGETHSASRYHEFQARRLNIRYRGADGKLQFVHTLNNTVIASPRILIPILELYQNADGTITVPATLRPYMGGMDRITPAI